jgi:hypothetical protein
MGLTVQRGRMVSKPELHSTSSCLSDSIDIHFPRNTPTIRSLAFPSSLTVPAVTASGRSVAVAHEIDNSGVGMALGLRAAR